MRVNLLLIARAPMGETPATERFFVAVGTNINTLFNDIAKCIADPKSADCKWKAATTTPTTP